MTNEGIHFNVDGRDVSIEEIQNIELSRYHHVFNIFYDKGIPVTLNGRELSLNELMELSLEDAKIALAQAKQNVGKDKLVELFRSNINESNQMWSEISETADYSKPYQQAIVTVKTDAISLVQFMLFNQKLAKENGIYTPSLVHPEHYYFEANSKGEQRIVETFGMYKEPSFLDLKPGDKKNYPITPDQDTDVVMMGKTYLADNGLDTSIIGMHQLKSKGKGMEVKLGVFLPQSAPKDIIEGHKWHLMVEFYNGLKFAEQQKPNFLQKMIFKLALKKLKSK